MKQWLKRITKTARPGIDDGRSRISIAALNNKNSPQSPIRDSDIHILFEIIGVHAVSYLLNISIAQATEIKDYHNLAQLSQRQTETLLHLVALQKSLPEDSFPTEMSRIAWVTYLTKITQGSTTANVLRSHSGCTLETADRGQTDAHGIIRSVVADFYIAAMVDISDWKSFPKASRVVNWYHHPQRPLFESHILSNRNIAKLFSEKNDASGHFGYTTRNTGRGGTNQLSQLVPSIIESALHAIVMKNDEISLSGLQSESIRQFEIILEASKQNHPELPVVMGISSCSLPESFSGFIFSIGELRRANHPANTTKYSDPQEDPFFGESSLSNQNYAPDELILHTSIPYTISVGNPKIEEQRHDRLIEAKELSDIQSIIHLGSILSDEHEVGFLHVSRVSLSDPLGSPIDVYFPTPEGSLLNAQRLLSEEEVSSWEYWTEQVSSRYSDAIQIPVQKTIDAASPFRQASDKLIDAVVVWESLFGGKGEISFKISLSIAWTLHPKANEEEERNDLYREVKGIYSIRSKVVHGTPLKASEDIWKYAFRATSISLQLMREFLRHESSIFDFKEAEKRVEFVLMGGLNKQLP